MFYPVDMNENDQMNVLLATFPTVTGVKQKILRYLKKVFMSNKFGAEIKLIKEIVGSRIIQKFVSMHARRYRYSKNDMNVRGR